MHIIGCTGESAFQREVIEMIEEAFNGNPMKLCQNRSQDLDYWLPLCSAVILAGGADLHPRTYGASILNDNNFSKFDAQRDRREVYIIRYCLANKIPLLGICRGHQILGAYFGLPFCTDLAKSEVCHQPHKQSITVSEHEPMHTVHLLPEADESFAVQDEVRDLCEGKQGEVILRRDLWVNSFHHQGLIYKPGIKTPGVTVLGFSEGLKDQSIIEMMCGEGWLSVQWHPEFDWRVNAASRMVLSKFSKSLVA